MNILNQIAAVKRREVDGAKSLIPTELMRDLAAEMRRTPIDMAASLRHTPGGIIAEFKRRSPSKGEIHPMASVTDVVTSYAKSGAGACSILTDTPFFGGSLADFDAARALVDVPLLRKEFVIDPYQILQARVHGADAVLLIAALLDPHQVGEYTEVAHDLGLQVLLELHTPDELNRYFSEIDMVGVNSRNLGNFTTDLDIPARMAAALPAGVLKVAESGIHSADDLRRLRAVGYEAFLIGEMLMSTPNPAQTLKNLINDIN